MKKLLIAFLIILSTGCKNTESAVVFTSEALQQEIFDPEGNQTTVGEAISQFKGNKIVIDLWASWCRDCIVSMPEIAQLQQKYPEVKFLFFSVDDKQENWLYALESHMYPNNVKGEQYFFNTGWKRPKSPDSKENNFIKFAKLDWIPRYMVLDANGKIINFYAKSVDDPHFLEALK
ncbi:TlpA family protein disulfide reductase [Capnocytophaga canimorsus]|uniref:TlpA family protein disulfide reductase n=1 Tax=Capnocytophaga canimorsus TaxID=28188 RepID=UPI000D6E7B02|nr:TlpA disulfide reductase family protein [Capnocytophaga canimorsus]AWL78490.1 alkyl hydroperoxide reductase [Capnocytophaga canimorsus]AYW37101.1 TlpA family protein disulfide reductase [Capnocytophaga canimorsus]MDT9499840.1 TlpA family protein disulfide reductase [Capnocytophaga canimorsus]